MFHLCETKVNTDLFQPAYVSYRILTRGEVTCNETQLYLN